MILTIVTITCFCLTVLLVNWRWGIYLIVLAGFLQDPIRKIIPDQPIHYSSAVLFVFAICLLLALLVNDSWRVRHLTLDNPRLEFSIGLYVAFVVFSGLYTLFTYDNSTVAILGLAIYLGPIVAAVYASFIFDNYRAVTRFINFYLIGISLLVLTIFMSVFGFEMKIFEEIGGGIDIYEHSIQGYLEAHAGIIRTSELAAWHLVTGACFSLILAIQSKSTTRRLILSLLTIACLLAGVFTGRRKMYALFAVFCLTLVLLIFYESNAKDKSFMVLAISAISIVFICVYVLFQKQILLLSFASDYLSRAFTLFDDTSDRLSITANSFNYTVKNIGFIGDGVGSTGQSISGFKTEFSNWNAETGLGRLGNELGILGLIISITMIVSLLRHILVTNKLVRDYDFKLSFFQQSLMAFLFANAINYFNAAQTYNDLFILLMLGLILGCVLSAPKIFYKTATRQP